MVASNVICLNSSIECRDDSSASIELFHQNTPLDTDPCDASNLETFNCSAAAFLLHERGDQMSSLSFVIPATGSYLLILLAGVIGNAMVCFTIATIRAMHNSVNYYLFNLAVADVLYLIFGLPFEIYMFWLNYPWIFGATFCKLKSLVTEACSYASVLTIVAFSVERYVAICHPLYVYHVQMNRIIYVIALIWIVSFMSATPFGYYRHLEAIHYPPPDGDEMAGSEICTMNTQFSGLYETSTVVFFVVPLVILTILYARIALTIHNSAQNHARGKFGESSKNATTRQTAYKKSIIRMLVVIVITFFISWAPFHAQRLIFVYGRDWPNYSAINQLLFTITGIFYYLACVINPVIYSVMSHRYREAFRQAFGGKKPNPRTSSTRSFEKQNVLPLSAVPSFDAMNK